MRSLLATLALLSALMLAVGGCPSDPTTVSGDTDGGADSAGTGDPGAGGDAGEGGDGGEQPPPEGTQEEQFIGDFSGHAQKVTAYRDTLSADEAYHLLRRTSLGAAQAEVDAAVARGLSATVDLLLGYQPVAAEVEALAAEYENDLPKRWMVQLMESPNVLHERVAMFWHDRFATSARAANDYSERNLPTQHWNMIRRNALGNYRGFLLELTLDPLMLLWLDGADSPKDNPNENYCREFWELFTLGRDTVYVEDDIHQGARAFTGITLLYQQNQDPRPIFDLYNHDNSVKMVFPGRAATAQNYDYISLTDLTLAQPEAAQYVARNLFVFFVHDHPSAEVVQALADEFKAGNWEIRPLVRRILTCQALFSGEARFNQIASPVEHFVGVARTLSMHIHSEDSQGYIMDRLSEDLRDAGQELMNPPGVEGWKEGENWLQDQWVMSRADALGRVMDYGDARMEDLPYHLLPPTTGWNVREVRGQIVDATAAAFHLPLTEAERDIYIEVLDQNGHRAFHLLQPNEQPRHVFEMIRLMAMDERVVTR